MQENPSSFSSHTKRFEWENRKITGISGESNYIRENSSPISPLHDLFYNRGLDLIKVCSSSQLLAVVFNPKRTLDIKLIPKVNIVSL